MSILSIEKIKSSFQNNIYRLNQCVFKNKQALGEILLKIRVIAVGIITGSSSFAVSPSFSLVTLYDINER